MKTDKHKTLRISLRLRESCPEHQALLRRCRNRDVKKYSSMTDYIASAVEEFETQKYIMIRLDIDSLTKEEQEAVNVLLQHNGK